MPDRLFTLNSSIPFNPALAAEIGINESLILLTLESLAAERGQPREGRLWLHINRKTAESLFTWIGHDKYRSIIDGMIESRLLVELDTRVLKKDTTRILAVNHDEARKLTSVAVATVGESIKPEPAAATLFDSQSNPKITPVITPTENYQERYMRVVTEGFTECCNLHLASLMRVQRATLEKQILEAIGIIRKLYPHKTCDEIKAKLICFGVWWTSKVDNTGHFQPPAIQTVIKHLSSFDSWCSSTLHAEPTIEIVRQAMQRITHRSDNGWTTGNGHGNGRARNVGDAAPTVGKYAGRSND